MEEDRREEGKGEEGPRQSQEIELFSSITIYFSTMQKHHFPPKDNRSLSEFNEHFLLLWNSSWNALMPRTRRRKVCRVLSFLWETPFGVPMGISPITLLYLRGKKLSDQSHRFPQHCCRSRAQTSFFFCGASVMKGRKPVCGRGSLPSENRAQEFPPLGDNVLNTRTDRNIPEGL